MQVSNVNNYYVPAVQPQQAKLPQTYSYVDSSRRIEYLRKLYTLVFIQLGIATWFCYYVYRHPQWIDQKDLTNANEKNIETVATWLTDNWVWTCVISAIVFGVINVVAFFAKNLIAKTPTNIICYLLFVLTFALLAGYTQAQLTTYTFKEDTTNNVKTSTLEYDYLLWITLLYLTAVVAALTVHSFSSKVILTWQTATLHIMFAIFVVYFLLDTYFQSYDITLNWKAYTDAETLKKAFTLTADIDYSQTHQLLEALIGLIFGFYLIWDNEIIIASNKIDWLQEDFISGACAIYMNLVSLFGHFGSLFRNSVYN